VDKDESKAGFRFVEPNGMAPRRHHSDQSPKKELSPTCSPQNKTSPSPGNESLGSFYTELLDLEKMVRYILVYSMSVR
jgi:hypothetical protein